MIFASLILGWLLSKMLTVPIETITANIDYIARGHHDEYITSSRIGPEGRLIASINNLMKSYNSKIDFALKDSQKTSVHLMNMLQTSCDKISQGLVIINTDNTVLLINDSFSKLFNLHKNECKNKHFYQIFNDKDAVAAIRDIRLKSYTNPDFFACSVLKMPFQDKTAKFNLAINSFSDSENRKLSILFFEFIGYEKA
jgi:transcriptional regulator with PAS, ATPase and Fis domain